MGELIDEISKCLYWFSLIMFIMGSLGNICFLIVYSRETLRKLSIAIYFRFISIINVFIAILVVNTFIQGNFNFNIYDQTKFLCKASYILTYALGPISTWLQVIVSFDRLLNIIFPSKISTLHKFNFQISIITTIFLANTFYYLFTSFDSDLISDPSNYGNLSAAENNATTIYCSLIHYNDLLNWLDLGNVLVTFVAMSFASVVTIIFIFRSRSRLHLKSSSSRVKRDLKFAITSILLNVFYLLTNAPYSLFYSIFYRLLANKDTNSTSWEFISLIASILWYFYYCFNFYLQLIVNSLVRSEFLKLLGRETEVDSNLHSRAALSTSRNK